MSEAVQPKGFFDGPPWQTLRDSTGALRHDFVIGAKALVSDQVFRMPPLATVQPGVLEYISATVAKAIADGFASKTVLTQEMREARADDVLADILAGRVSRGRLERLKDAAGRALQDEAVGRAFRPR